MRDRCRLKQVGSVLEKAEFIIKQISRVSTKWKTFRDRLIDELLTIDSASSEFELYCIIDKAQHAFRKNSNSRLLQVLNDANSALCINRNKAYIEHQKRNMRLRSNTLEPIASNNQTGLSHPTTIPVAICTPVNQRDTDALNQTTNSAVTISEPNGTTRLEHSVLPYEEVLSTVSRTEDEGVKINGCK